MAATKAAGDEGEEYPTLDYDFEDEIEVEDSDEVEIVVTTVTMSYPGKGALTMMVVDSNENQSAAMMAFIRKCVSAADYRFIRAALGSEKVTMPQLQEMVMDAVEAWATFPTKQRSGSTRSPQRTGTRSTGRAPGAGSTRASSSRAASSRSS